MKKVYLLMGRSIVSEAEHVLGVFSSRKKVNEAISWLLDVDTYYKKFPDRLHTEIFELNGERIENRTHDRRILNVCKKQLEPLYDEICAKLTDFECGDDSEATEGDWMQDFYLLLVKVQNAIEKIEE